MSRKNELFMVIPVRLVMTALFTYFIVQLIHTWKNLMIDNQVIGGIVVLSVSFLLTFYTAKHFNNTMKKLELIGKVTSSLFYFVLSYVVFRGGIGLFVDFHLTPATISIVFLTSVFVFLFSMKFAKEALTSACEKFEFVNKLVYPNEN